MKKKPSLSVFISFSIIVLLFSLYFLAKEDVEVTDVAINCKDVPCKVDFYLINNLNYYVSCKVSIRGFRTTPGRNTPGAVKPGFTGEKILAFELHPKEMKEVKETLKISEPTSRIKVRAFNTQILQ